MLLTAYTIDAAPCTDKAWDESELSGNPALLFEASASSGYEDISSVENFDTWWASADTNYMAMRNNLIAVYITPGTYWSGATDDQKKTLIRHYVWPSAETDTNLDALYTDAERMVYAKECMKKLNTLGCVIRISVTDGSVKFMELGADDTATLVTQEVTTDTELVEQYA